MFNLIIFLYVCMFNNKIRLLILTHFNFFGLVKIVYFQISLTQLDQDMGQGNLKYKETVFKYRLPPLPKSSVPVRPFISQNGNFAIFFSKETITLGYILLIDAQNMQRESTDAHRYSSKPRWLDAECSSWAGSLEVLQKEC